MSNFKDIYTILIPVLKFIVLKKGTKSKPKRWNFFGRIEFPYEVDKNEVNQHTQLSFLESSPFLEDKVQEMDTKNLS